MANIAPQLSQFAANTAGAAQQYQPYPYNTVPYNSDPSAVYNSDQFGSASSLPGGQVQNYLQSPPTVNGANPASTQGLRFGDRTSPSGRRAKQQRRPQPGPVSAKADGSAVVPYYSYSTLQNGTLVQVPLFWTALSIALGYEVRGDEVIRGAPCIRRLYQIFCRNAGSQYPIDRIESFISENRALTRRMFGEFPRPSDIAQEGRSRSRRFAEGSGDNSTIGVPPPHPVQEHEKLRRKRQTVKAPPAIDKGSKHLEDSCESKVELITPYWAANSAGEIRAIVNTKHFPQAIHQEICKGTSTNRCTGDCICEQKYTYHRLLAYDPDNDCKGIFIDWFLFPSCCACRCPP